MIRRLGGATGPLLSPAILAFVDRELRHRALPALAGGLVAFIADVIIL